MSIRGIRTRDITGFDYNVDNYQISELTDIIGLDYPVSKDDVESATSDLIKIYKEPLIIAFIKDIREKLIEYINDNNDDEIEIDEKYTHYTKTHPDDTDIFSHKYTSGYINPLDRRTIPKIINVDSLFRVNFYTSNSNTFDIVLPSPIKNVLSMKVKSLELPNCVYMFNVLNTTNQFQITVSGVDYLIEIREGNYTGPELVDYFNDVVFPYIYSGALSDVVVSYDTKYERIVFSAATGSGFEFDLNFIVPEFPNRSITLNMGWLMGFRKSSYLFNDDYKTAASMTYDIGFNADACYTGNTFRYLFLSVNEFKNNYNDTIIPVFTYNSMLPIHNILAILRYDPERGMIVSGHSNDLREYFGPVSIEKLRVVLYDEFGRLAAINNVDFSFQLELDCLYNSEF